MLETGVRIRFNRAQLVAFSRASHLRFRRRLGDLLVDCFAEARGAARADVDARVATTCVRAARYGFESEQDVATFVALAWLLGENFDTRVARIRALLADGRLEVDDKAEQLAEYLRTDVYEPSHHG